MTPFFSRNSLSIKVTRTLITLFLLVASTPSIGQKKEKRLTLFPIPAIYYSPETRFVFGAALTATYRFPRDTGITRPSNITVGAAYTQNKQILAYSNFTVFYDQAKYYAFGEAGYYVYNYNFYGVGTKEVPEELYGVDYPRIKLNLTRRIFPHIYAGPGFQYEDYVTKELLLGGELIKGDVTGAKGSRTVGVGAQVIYDTRDTVLYPGKGWFASASYMNQGAHWGSIQKFDRYVVDIAYYKTLWPKFILALNSYNSFVVGDAPFQQLSLIGGNKKLRGYYNGRYIDNNLVVAQAEGRFPIYGRLGGVVFGAGGFLGNQQDFLRTNDLKYAVGGGLRFNAVRKDHLNIRFDYAVGPGTSGIYFTIGEAF